jgi:hypothetical protein
MILIAKRAQIETILSQKQEGLAVAFLDVENKNRLTTAYLDEKCKVVYNVYSIIDEKQNLNKDKDMINEE